jgi:DNA-binding MarR family transcriptional regulator
MFESFGGQLRKLSEAWNDVFHGELDRRGVTRGQWRFLRELWREDGITQVELAARVGRKEPTVASALKLLQRGGFVRLERSREDRRKIRVHLTERGRALEARLMPLVHRFDALGAEALTPEEVARFRELMRRIKATLDGLAGVRWADAADDRPERRAPGPVGRAEPRAP